jgi:hypothetical protein
MKSIVVCVATLVAAIAGGCVQAAEAQAPKVAQAAAQPSPAGTWHGAITRAPIGEIRLELRLEEKPPGAFSGVLANMDQGGLATPLADVKLEGAALSFSVPATRASFAGNWDMAAKAWSGEYRHPAGNSAAKFEAGPAPPLPPLPAVSGLDGRWEGTVQGMAPVVVRIETDASGTRAWMDTPAQQAVGMAIRKLTRDGAHVTFALPALMMSFDGQLEGDKLVGAISQAGQGLPLALTRTSASAAPVKASARPQIPQRPYPYREETAVIANPAAPGLNLGCTLTAPNSEGPHPAVVLIGGSGAEDRDLTGAGHKTFLVLADHLTRKGIAALRCDDRDFGKPADAMKTSLVRDFAGDVKAELAWLRGRPGIDAKRVGVLGGSLGGVIGPVVAADDRDVAFVVMLAGLGVPAVDAMVEQRAMIAQSEGASAAEVAAIRALWPGVHRQIRDAKDDAAAQGVVKAALAKTPKARPPVYPTDDIAVGMMASRYARDLYLYDPAPVFAKIKAPVLSLIGSLDVQVSAQQNNEGLRKLLARHPDAIIVDLPGVNHMFQRAKTGAMSEYAMIEESFAPEALETISSWIAKRFVTGG